MRWTVSSFFASTTNLNFNDINLDLFMFTRGLTYTYVSPTDHAIFGEPLFIQNLVYICELLITLEYWYILPLKNFVTKLPKMGMTL